MQQIKMAIALQNESNTIVLYRDHDAPSWFKRLIEDLYSSGYGERIVDADNTKTYAFAYDCADIIRKSLSRFSRNVRLVKFPTDREFLNRLKTERATSIEQRERIMGEIAQLLSIMTALNKAQPNSWFSNRAVFEFVMKEI